MRQRLVMGNWKLNGTKETVVSLIKAFAAEANKYPRVEAAICAPAIFIGLVEENAKGSRLVTIHSRLVQELQPSIFEGYFIAA